MLIMDTELAQRAITESKIRIPTIAKLKDNTKVDLYFLYFNSEEYIIAEIDSNNDNKPKYYMVDEREIGDTIIADKEWRNALKEGATILRFITNLLKDINNY